MPLKYSYHFLVYGSAQTSFLNFFIKFITEFAKTAYFKRDIVWRKENASFGKFFSVYCYWSFCTENTDYHKLNKKYIFELFVNLITEFDKKAYSKRDIERREVNYIVWTEQPFVLKSNLNLEHWQPNSTFLIVKLCGGECRSTWIGTLGLYLGFG